MKGCRFSLTILPLLLMVGMFLGCNLVTKEDTADQKEPLTLFKVTGVTASVNPASFNGVCPRKFNFSATVTVNGPVTVTYKWERSDGAIAPTRSITFVGAGSQTVTETWTLSPSSYNGWQRLHVLTPNDTTSNQATFTLTCIPFAVTGVAASVDPKSYTGLCPKTFHFTGVITVNGPGTVKYRWEHSPGTGLKESVTFDDAGSKTVTKDYSSSTPDFLALAIDEPTNSTTMYSLVDFKVTCLSGR